MFDRRKPGSTTQDSENRSKTERRANHDRRSANRRDGHRAGRIERRSALFPRRWCGIHAH